MFEPESSFRKAVHDRALKSPTSATFDPMAWKDALDKAVDKTMGDTLLAATGLWIAQEINLLRKFYGDLTFDRIGRAQWLILAIAFANREFRTADDLQRDYFRAKPKSSSVDISYKPLLRDSTGKEMDHAGFNESIVDTLESWMFDLREGPIDSVDPPPNLFPLIHNASMRMNIQRELNRLWNQASWEGYHLSVSGERRLWVPNDFKSAKLLEATKIRHEEYSKNLAMIDFSTWSAMDPKTRIARMLMQTVKEVKKHRGGPRKIRLGKPNVSKSIDHYAFERAVLEGSYLANFMDRSMPKASSLTASLLLQAWHVLVDFALAIKEPTPEGALDEKDAKALALLAKRGELLNVITRCLSIDQQTAETVINFLTFELKKPKEKGHRGFWSAPLVQIPGQERYAFCLAALLTSNPLRKVEAWLEKGGIDDSQLGSSGRGDDYEVYLRKTLCKKIKDNRLLSVSTCSEHAIKKTDSFPEQIDLLIRLGSILIVGEVKCWLFPADSFERWEYFGKLRAASAQARRKGAAIGQRLDIAAKALGIPETELTGMTVIPLIVTNQGFAATAEIDGCRVIDERFLANYLGDGVIVTGAITKPGIHWNESTTTFYSNEAEAAANFESTVARPSVLYRFYDRIDWVELPFPTADSKGLFISTPQMRQLNI
jgi:hypothetical protein